jgi:hypothetical protein
MLYLVMMVLAHPALAANDVAREGEIAAVSRVVTTDARTAAWDRFRAQQPNFREVVREDRITTMYGPAFGFAPTAREAADGFLVEHSRVFGVQPTDLRFERSFELMHGKFTAVQYVQSYEGVAVHQAGITVLVRHDVGNGIVLLSVDLHNLLNVALAPVADAPQVAVDVARSAHPNLTFTEPELVVFAGAAGPLYVWRFVGENDDLTAPEKYEFLVDAGPTPRLVRAESQIHYVDVNGNVSGQSTQGQGSDQCAPDGLEGLPYAWVGIQGGNNAYTQHNGDFVIPHGGSSPVTVESPIRGRWFRVQNQAGQNAVLTQQVTPPGPANFVHNPLQQEFTRAEVNGYIEANVVRDYTLLYSPNYPVIETQTEFPVNVNVSGSCNAFYNGSSVNFYRSGGSCPNMAYGTVVHHEYGHHLVASGGSGQGQYGEGASDTMGVVIFDDPRLAPGFFGNCNQPLRNADNNMQYPCGGPIHDCGQLISGCIWDTRNELIVTEPNDYRDIISTLWINSIPLHRGSEITPDITVHILTLDDDDGNINNGTPHYEEIDTGFGAHNMHAPPLALLQFNYPNGRPERVAPGGGDRVRVEVEGVVKVPEPGTGLLHYSTGEGFQEVALAIISPNVYDIVFPPIECGEYVQYYLTAETTDGDMVSDPYYAPDETYSALAATSVDVSFEDDFETNRGWGVINENLQDGAWQRAVPFGAGGGAPSRDYDGSGRCYVTGNRLLQDIDGGPTRLISPTLDMSSGAARIRYAVWFLGTPPDSLVVDVSNDGGITWTVVETISITSAWELHEHFVGDYVEPSANVRVRFSATDAGSNTTCEAGLDAFEVISLGCGTAESFQAAGYQVTRGEQTGGTLEDLFDSDDQYISIESRRANELAAASAELEVFGFAPVGDPVQIKLTVEASASAEPVRWRTELYNFRDGEWETVDEREATGGDNAVTLTVSSDVTRFIKAGTLEVRTRVGFIDFGVPFPGWGAKVDHVAFSVIH